VLYQRGDRIGKLGGKSKLRPLDPMHAVPVLLRRHWLYSSKYEFAFIFRARPTPNQPGCVLPSHVEGSKPSGCVLRPTALPKKCQPIRHLVEIHCTLVAFFVSFVLQYVQYLARMTAWTKRKRSSFLIDVSKKEWAVHLPVLLVLGYEHG
jgi:hypothetical protein